MDEEQGSHSLSPSPAEAPVAHLLKWEVEQHCSEDPPFKSQACSWGGCLPKFFDNFDSGNYLNSFL